MKIAVILILAVIGTTWGINYDVDLSFSMLYYSKTSYCSGDSIAKWNCEPCSYHQGMEDIQVYYNATHHAQGFSGYDPKSNQIIVAFRGSTDTTNWINNLKFVETDYPLCQGCKVHLGFFQTYKDIKSDIINAVTTLKGKHPNALIAITGHSLGGAIATLSALDIDALYTVNVFYNYGSPRVGNSAFEQYFYSEVPEAVRVTHYKDIVVHLPPIDFGYHHIPTEVWYNNQPSSTYVVCNNSGEDPNCADSVKIFSVADHTQYLGLYTGC